MNTLNLRNFDEELTAAEALDTPHPEPEEPEPQEQSFSETEVQAMLEDMRARAFEEGRRIGAQETRDEMEAAVGARTLETLETLHGALSELASESTRRRAEMEHAMVDLALGVSERLIPEILHVHAPDLVAARVRSGLRMATGEAGLSIRVAEQLAPQIAEFLGKWVEPGVNGMDVSIEPAPDLPLGAARLVWKNGYLYYDLDRVCDALLKELREAAQLMTEQLGRSE